MKSRPKNIETSFLTKEENESLFSLLGKDRVVSHNQYANQHFYCNLQNILDIIDNTSPGPSIGNAEPLEMADLVHRYRLLC